MTEIEKLYKNAGVSKRCCGNQEACLQAPPYCEKYNYPSFTTEKQIELIKWLSEHYLLEIRRIKDTQEYYIGFNAYKRRVWNATMNFENTLAKLINNLWQELTDSDKEQIRSILNG